MTAASCATAMDFFPAHVGRFGSPGDGVIEVPVGTCFLVKGRMKSAIPGGCEHRDGRCRWTAISDADNNGASSWPMQQFELPGQTILTRRTCSAAPPDIDRHTRCGGRARSVSGVERPDVDRWWPLHQRPRPPPTNNCVEAIDQGPSLHVNETPGSKRSHPVGGNKGTGMSSRHHSTVNPTPRV